MQEVKRQEFKARRWPQVCVCDCVRQRLWRRGLQKHGGRRGTSQQQDASGYAFDKAHEAALVPRSNAANSMVQQAGPTGMVSRVSIVSIAVSSLGTGWPCVLTTVLSACCPFFSFDELEPINL